MVRPLASLAEVVIRTQQTLAKIGGWLLLAACSSGPLFAASLSPEQKADRIVGEAGSIRALLRSKHRLKLYYRALADYYGGEDAFPRAAFDAIAGQLKDALEKIPELDQILFSTEDLGESFSFQTFGTTTGSESDPQEWETFLKNWERERNQRRVKNPHRILMRTGREIDAYLEQERQSTKGRRTRTRERAEFFTRLRSSAEVVGALNTTLSRIIQRSQIFDANGAPVVARARYLLEHLRSAPRNFPELGEYSSALLSLFAGMIPESGRPESRYVLSPEPESWSFDPLLRRIHGIWVGIRKRECIGGDVENLASLNPARWLVIALSGSRQYHLKRNGVYRGYTQEVPVMHGQERGISLDLLASELATRFIFQAGRRIWSETLFEQYLSRRRQQDSQVRYFMGNSFGFNNDQGSDLVRRSAAYLLGRDRGSAKDISTGNPLEARIAQLVPPVDLAEQYLAPGRRRMVFEVAVPASSRVIELEFSPKSVHLEDAAWVKDQFEKHSVDREARVWTALSYGQINPALKEVMVEESNLILAALNSVLHPMHSAAKELIQYADRRTFQGVFRAFFPEGITAEQFFKNLKAVHGWAAKPGAIREGVLNLNDELVRNLNTRGFTLAQIRDLGETIKHAAWVSTLEKVHRLAISKTQTFSEYLWAAKSFYGSDGSDSYGQARDLAVKETLSARIQVHGATLDGLLELMESSRSIGATLQAQTSALAYVKTPEDFLAVARGGIDQASDSYQDERNRWLEQNIDLFWSLNPSSDHILQLRQYLTDPPLVMRIAEKIQPTLSAGKYLRLLMPRDASENWDENAPFVQYVENNWPAFLNLKPKGIDFHILTRRAMWVSQIRQILELGLKHLDSPTDRAVLLIPAYAMTGPYGEMMSELARSAKRDLEGLRWEVKEKLLDAYVDLRAELRGLRTGDEYCGTRLWRLGL